MKLMRMTSLGLLLLVMLWLTSCGRPQQTQRDHEGITEAKALELAKAAFGKTGRRADEYRVTIEADSTGQKWIAWFDRKGAYAPAGGKHAVTVEKATGITVFMPGE